MKKPLSAAEWGIKMNNIKELDKKYVANTYARFPVLLEHGSGSLVYDDAGKEYIDLGAGIAVTSFGIADSEWAADVTEQLTKLQHCSNLYFTGPCALLAEKLCEATGMKKVFFGNSGAEANECAIKAARKYSFDKYGPDRYKIVTLVDSFHGRTIATLSATGQPDLQNGFQPMVPGFIYTPANDCEALKALVESESGICAFMFELIQGESGVNVLSQEFVDCMVSLAKEHDILLVDDEVQSGNGRTGTLYAYMQYGFTPDIMSTAKGLGGGLPIGACLLGEKVQDTMGAGTHGSTFGGNPAVCAGALNILSRIDDELLADVKAKGEYIVKELSSAPGVKGISGKGLMIGIETEKSAGDVLNECMANGVLVLTAHGKVRLVPALNIPMELVEKAVAVIKAACA